MCPQASYNTRTFQGVSYTRFSFPWGRSAPILWENIHVSRPLQLRHGHSNVSEQLGMESAVPKPCRKSALRGAKTVQDTLRSLKAIWHFVKFNSIPHILPALSKLLCPTNLAPLPCLPLQNRISFQREMCPSKICIFLASNYGNIFHLLCLSLGVFSLPFGIAF